MSPQHGNSTMSTTEDTRQSMNEWRWEDFMQMARRRLQSVLARCFVQLLQFGLVIRYSPCNGICCVMSYPDCVETAWGPTRLILLHQIRWEWGGARNRQSSTTTLFR
jgi:hypothetical protein